MINTPVTPVGTPQLPQRWEATPRRRLTAALQEYRQVWLEPQDRAGRWCLGVLSLSAVQASIGLLWSVQLIAFHPLWNLYFPISHFISPWLLTLPLVFGFASGKRLANAVAWFTIASLFIWSGWAWVPWRGHSNIVKILYLCGSFLALAPTVFRLLRRPFR